MHLDDELGRRLQALRNRALLRVPPLVAPLSFPEALVDGRRAIVFSSNDYLGFTAADDPPHSLVGSGASRLVSGTHPTHVETEHALASYVGLEAALLFSSGYAANVGALSALVGRHDIVFSDRLNHASLIDGIRLSRATPHVYPHCDLARLDALLRAPRPSGARAWVVSDALFSMDGDLPDLAHLRHLCDRHGAYLYLDEAHSLGIVGPQGRGACAEAGIVPDVLVGAFGKAFGLAGAFVAGSAVLRSYLENRARSYAFSTAPPAALARLIAQRTRELEAADARRARLARYTETLRSTLRAQGWSVPPGRSPIVPVLVGEPDATMALSAQLLERGFYVRGIRPPTVPEGTSRLRIVPTAAHTPEQIEGLLRAFAALRVSHPPTEAG